MRVCSLRNSGRSYGFVEKHFQQWPIVVERQIHLRWQRQNAQILVDVLLFLAGEHVLIEMILNLLVGDVNTQLLECIGREVLEAEDVQNRYFQRLGLIILLRLLISLAEHGGRFRRRDGQ